MAFSAAAARLLASRSAYAVAETLADASAESAAALFRAAKDAALASLLCSSDAYASEAAAAAALLELAFASTCACRNILGRKIFSAK